LPQSVIDRLVAAIQKSQQAPEWKAYLRQVTQLDGFQKRGGRMHHSR